MNETLMGTSIKDVGRNIQQLSRDNKKLERYLNSIGTSSDTEQFRLKLKDEIHETTTLVKSLLSNIQDLKSVDNSNKLQRLEKQFLEQYTKLSQVTKTIKNRLESTKPSSSTNGNNNTHSLNKVKFGASSGSQQQQNNPFLSQQNNGAYDLEHVNLDNMEHYENHPDMPPEEEEQALSTKQSFIPQFDAHLDELENREEAIHQMVDDLTELNSMYKDLHGLVNEQGENIEVLASNVVDAKEQVASGVVHLDKAASHQRKYRKKMCIILMIVLVMAVCLTLAIYYTTSSKKSGK